MKMYRVSAVLYSNVRKNENGTFKKNYTITNKVVNEQKMYSIKSKFENLSLNKGLDWFQAIGID
jgi:hypothetical protein